MIFARSSVFFGTSAFLLSATLPLARIQNACADPSPTLTSVASPETKQKSYDDSAILDLRIRPFALLTQTPGAEFAFPIFHRFELGPTIHYFTGNNDVRGSSVNSWELGLKATYLIWERSFREGAYLSGAFYNYFSQVIQNNPYASTGRFSTRGFTFTAGYQWNLGWFHSDRLSLRLGGGVGYRQQYIVDEQGSNGQLFSLGLIERVQPTLELTLGAFL
jgi:hypothetical protein